MTTTYCAAADVQFVLSEVGVTLRTDDDEDRESDADQITSAIEIAATTMNQHLDRRYILSQLSGNAWCKWTNAYLAAFVLDSRQNNQPGPRLTEERAERLEFLKEIASGNEGVPEQTESYDQLPCLSNYTLEQWQAMPVRVREDISTRPPAAGTPVKRNPAYHDTPNLPYGN